MDGANSPGQARAYWITPFPFQPSGGGLGISLTCTTSSGSSRTALVGTGNTFVIANIGDAWGHIAFGNSSVTATTACMAIPPGTCITISLNDPKDSAEWTYAAGITTAGTTTLQITRGFGV